MTPEQQAIHDAAATLRDLLTKHVPDTTADYRVEQIKTPLMMLQYGTKGLVTHDVKEHLNDGQLARLNPHLDHQDLILLIGHLAEWYLRDGTPRVGDLVRFNDSDTLHRCAHRWGDEYMQTAPGGSYHLGDGYMSMSGSLDGSIPLGEFVDTQQPTVTTAWIWHHDRMQAHNGLPVQVYARVYAVDRPTP